MKVLVKKVGTIKVGEGHVSFKVAKEPQEFEDSLAKRMIEFGYAEKVEGEIATPAEEVSSPIESDPMDKAEAEKTNEEVKEEVKEEVSEKNKKGKKSVMFSSN